jgi:hypothetical protein
MGPDPNGKGGVIERELPSTKTIMSFFILRMSFSYIYFSSMGKALSDEVETFLRRF